MKSGGMLSRLSREFDDSPVSFPPIDFQYSASSQTLPSQSSVNVTDSQWDVILPWEEEEEEGSDHADDEFLYGEKNKNKSSLGPLHRQEEQLHSHINSGGNSYMNPRVDKATQSHKTPNQLNQFQSNHEQQQQPKEQSTQQRQTHPMETQQHQKSLRLRAAKYFNASPSNSSNHTQYDPDEIIATKQIMNRLSPTNSSTASTDPSSSKNSLSDSQNQKAANDNNPATNITDTTTQQRRRNKPAFFPKTRVPSKTTIHNVNSSSSSSIVMSSESNKLETASTYSAYSDPPLHNDNMSQISTNASNVSYGSDLENAARRILGRRKGQFLSKGNNNNNIDGGDDDEREVIGSTNSVAASTASSTQRRPSRERMLKVTRRRVGLPARYGSDSSDVDSDVDESRHSRIDMTQHNAQTASINGDDSCRPNTQQGEEDEMMLAAILRSNAEKNKLRSQQLNNNDDEEMTSQTGAFPSFKVSNNRIDSNGDDTNFIDWNNISTTLSWGHPEKAFDDRASQEENDEDYDADYDPKDSLNYTKSDVVLEEDIVNNSSSSDWDNGWYQNRQKSNGASSSSIVGDAGGDEASEDTDDDANSDYFHDFGSKPNQSWGLNSQQQMSWEDLPTPTRFSPRQQSIGGGGQSSYAARAIAASQYVSYEQDDEYVTRTSEIDFFAWDDDQEHIDNNEIEDGFDGTPLQPDEDVLSQQHAERLYLPTLPTDAPFDEPNESMSVLADEEKKTTSSPTTEQPLLTMDFSPAKNEPYPVSDGDTPSRKSRKRLPFFRSRVPSEGIYYSEGEISDSDWEPSPSNASSTMTPVRSKRWKNKQKMSPRSLKLFIDRRQDKHKKDEEEVLPTHYEVLRKDSESTKSCVENVSQDKIGDRQNDNLVIPSVPPISSQETVKLLVPKRDNGKPITSESEQTNQPINRKVLTPASNSESRQVTPDPELTKAAIHQLSTRSSTPLASAEHLNDSLLTQITPVTSNKALWMDMSLPPSGIKTKSAPPKLPPSPQDSQQAVKKVSKATNKPSSPGFTGSDVIVNNKNQEEDEITLLTDSLGSLITTASQTSTHKTNTSIRSGNSEIQRLRRENERLREKLEIRSTVSSRVSSAYVRSLQEQNDLLRLHLKNTPPNRHNTRRNDDGMMYKSSIAALLESDGLSQQRRSRRKDSHSPRKPTFHKPIKPITLADFDDESITTFSESVKEKKVHLIETNSEGVPGILQTIASTTQRVAAQMKTSAQDRNGSSSQRSCATCASTAHSTKEVIGRAFGCIKSSSFGTKATETTIQTTESDSLVDGRAIENLRVMYGIEPGADMQM
eukprot:scaffold103135_cov71-Cyclotella_meneghiniana.AAC.10